MNLRQQQVGQDETIELYEIGQEAESRGFEARALLGVNLNPRSSDVLSPSASDDFSRETGERLLYPIILQVIEREHACEFVDLCLHWPYFTQISSFYQPFFSFCFP